MPLFWCSFATPDEFLGVVVTEAENREALIVKLHENGWNPGGELLAYPIDEEGKRASMVPRDRMLGYEDMMKLRDQIGGIVRMKDAPKKLKKAIHDKTCNHCKSNDILKN